MFMFSHDCLYFRLHRIQPIGSKQQCSTPNVIYHANTHSNLNSRGHAYTHTYAYPYTNTHSYV